MDLHVVTYSVGSYKVLDFSDEDNNDMNTMVVAKTNIGYFCDIEMIMGLICIMPLLEAMHAFIKFVQGQNTFVCDFLTFFKKNNVELYKIIWILKRNIIKSTSRPSSTYINLQMTNCWLDGGLIIRQTCSLWFFISWTSNINCIRWCHFTSVFTQAIWDDWTIAFEAIKV